jgi:hypothetical protein
MDTTWAYTYTTQCAHTHTELNILYDYFLNYEGFSYEYNTKLKETNTLIFDCRTKTTTIIRRWHTQTEQKKTPRQRWHMHVLAMISSTLTSSSLWKNQTLLAILGASCRKPWKDAKDTSRLCHSRYALSHEMAYVGIVAMLMDLF